MSTKNIEVSEDWLYHRFDSTKLNKILKSGGLKARKHLSKSDKKEARNGVWNGNHFISLAKKSDEKDSAYDHYITGEFAFIVEGVNAIKTKRKELESIFESLAKLPIKTRYSFWIEEYQVKDFIPIENIIGLKIPNGERFFKMLYSKDHNIKEVEKMIKVLDKYDYDLPFIDVEEGKVISRDEVKKYMKKREK